MIQSTIETKAAPAQVWDLWRSAHQMDETFVPGKKGSWKGKRSGSFSYRILEVSEGKSFAICWKSLFVRLIFTHSVAETPKGSQICYRVQIRGPFAWPMRRLLAGKIQKNLSLVLTSLARELEAGVKASANDRSSP